MTRSASERIRAYYERLHAEHGVSPRGVGWNGAESQRLRFEVLLGVVGEEEGTLHEVGAGFGALVPLVAERLPQVTYSGSDLAEHAVAAARERFPGVRFDRVDLLAEELPDAYDYVVASGVFNFLPQEDAERWEERVREMIGRMWRAARRGVAFNAMTDMVDFRDPELFYWSPSAAFEFARTLSRRVVLRHDYPLYEFTVYVLR